MRRIIKSAKRRQLWAQMRAASVGFGLLASSVSIASGADGIYRSLSSGDVTYVEPADVPTTLSFSDQGPTPVPLDLPGTNLTSAPVDSGIVHPVAPGQSLNAPMHFEQQPMVYHGGGSSVNPCCIVCDRNYYSSFDAVWLTRAGDFGFTLSRGSFLDEFDYDLGGRFTVGQLFDCVDGVEFSYMGPFKWANQTAVAGGPLNSFLNPFGGFVGADINTFNNSTTHVQRWFAELQGIEFNRRWWAGDIMSTLVGIDIAQYKEIYQFDTTSPAGSGLYFQKVSNLLTGLHIGGDMQFPLSQRLSFGAKGRLGAYINSNKGATLLTNNNALLINNVDKDTDVSAILESGSVVKYRILPNVVASASYEFTYMLGVATVPQQRLHGVHPLAGSRISASDEVVFHGGTAGIEISY